MSSVNTRNSILSKSTLAAVTMLLMLGTTACSDGGAASSEQQRKDAEAIAKLREQQSSPAPAASKDNEPKADAPKVSDTDSEGSDVAQANERKEAEVQAAIASQEVSGDVTLKRVKEETNEALAVADAFLKQQESKYHSKIDTELTAFRARVEQLEARATNAASEAKEKVTAQLSELRKQMTVTGSQLGDFNKSSETELSALNAELNKLLSDLENGSRKTPEVSSKDDTTAKSIRSAS